MRGGLRERSRMTPEPLPLGEPCREFSEDIGREFQNGFRNIVCALGGGDRRERADREAIVPFPVRRGRNERGKLRERLEIRGRKIRRDICTRPRTADLDPRWELKVREVSSVWCCRQHRNDVWHGGERRAVHIALVSERAPKRDPWLALTRR